MEKYSKQDDMGKVMDNMRWDYLGHMLRKRKSQMAVSLRWELEGKKSPGRQKTTRQRVILDRVKTAGINGDNNKK